MQLFFKVSRVGRKRCRVNDDHRVKSASQGEVLCIDDRSELAFQPVPDHRAFESAPGPQSHPRSPLAVRQHTNRQGGPSGPSASSVDRAERFGELKPRWNGRRLGGNAQAGMSCQRPFRRRRLSVLRPPRVLIRWRNPCVRLRLRFDLLRRCFFTAVTLYVPCPDKIKEEISLAREKELEPSR